MSKETSIITGPASGFRDMMPEQMIPRQKMIDTIKSVYQGYGFVPFDTPAVEREDTLRGKSGDNRIYLVNNSFSDGTGEFLALRFDLTVPLARAVGQHLNEIKLPFKRYQVGNVWRGDRPQAGRYREFMQFDADTVGGQGAIADAEIVAMMSDTMEGLRAKAYVRVNNRLILDGLVEKAGIEKPEDKKYLVSIIDRLEKVGEEEVLSDIKDDFSEKTRDLVYGYLHVYGSPEQKLTQLNKLLDNQVTSEGVENLQQVFKILQFSGYDTEKVVFDQTIARGLNYYTGIIYETTLKDNPGIGSVCSGGRFDHLIEALGGPDLPAVGTSVGVDRLFEGLRQIGQIDSSKTNSEVLVANMDDTQAHEYMKIASTLRKNGIPTEVYFERKKLGNQFKLADDMGISWVALAGEDEMSKGVVRFRNSTTKEEFDIPVNEISDFIKKNR